MPQIACITENTRYSWRTTAYVDYTATYNKETNKTTIKLTDFNVTYWGTSGYYTTITASIKAYAVDATSNPKTASVNITGTTNGGSKKFSQVPSPSTLEIEHSSASGEKSVKIEVTVSIYAAMSGSTQAYANGNASVTAVVGKRSAGAVLIDVNGAQIKSKPVIGTKKVLKVLINKSGTIYTIEP